MKKHLPINLLAVLLFIFGVSLSGCSGNPASDIPRAEITATTTAGTATIKTITTTQATAITPPTTETVTTAVWNAQYRLAPAMYGYEDTIIVDGFHGGLKIEISYPQVVGLADEDLRGKINLFIRDEVCGEYYDVSWYYDDNYWFQYSSGLDYTVKITNDNLLSFIYKGMRIFNRTTRHNFATTNINMQTGEKIALSDVVFLNERFVEVFRRYAIAQTKERFSHLEFEHPSIADFKEMSTEKLLDLLGRADKTDPDGYGMYSYYTDTALGISFGIIHALGDHIEFEIEWEHLDEFLTEEWYKHFTKQ